MRLDVGEGFFLHDLAGLDELDGFHAADFVAEEIADGGLQDLVHQILHGADHGDDARGLGVGNVDEDLEVDGEDKALVALGDDGFEPRVEAVGAGDVLGPVELEDGGEDDFGVVDAGVDGIFAGAQRFLPDALMAGAHEAAEFEADAGSVLRGQADVGLDDGDLALLDDQHGDLLHADEEGIEVVSAVEKRIVLQADFAAGIEELLEVLVVVVQRVFAAEDGGDELEVGGVRLLFEFCDIVEESQTAGDGTCLQRLAFKRGDDADHVRDFAALGGPGRDARDFELALFEAEGREGEAARLVGQLAVGVGDGNAEDLRLGDDEEGYGMDGGQHAGRKHRPLHALLAAVGDEV